MQRRTGTSADTHTRKHGSVHTLCWIARGILRVSKVQTEWGISMYLNSFTLTHTYTQTHTNSCVLWRNPAAHWVCSSPAQHIVSHSQVYGFNRAHFISSSSIIRWSIMHAVIIDSAMTAHLTYRRMLHCSVDAWGRLINVHTGVVNRYGCCVGYKLMCFIILVVEGGS